MTAGVAVVVVAAVAPLSQLRLAALRLITLVEADAGADPLRRIRSLREAGMQMLCCRVAITESDTDEGQGSCTSRMAFVGS